MLSTRGYRLPSSWRSPVTVVGWLGDDLGGFVESVGRRVNQRLKVRVRAALQDLMVELTSEVSKAGERLPGLDSDPDLQFAMERVLPLRVEAARRYLSAEHDQRGLIDLIRFLNLVRQSVRARVREASTPQDVSDAVTATLDDIHGYLLAHDLVDKKYRMAEALLLDDLAGRTRLARRLAWKPARVHYYQGHSHHSQQRRRAPSS